MKFKNKVIKISCGFMAIVGIAINSSCESFLDINKYIYDQVTIDSVFISKDRLTQYINGSSSFLPDESMIWSTDAYSPSGLAADEAIVPWADGNHRGEYLLIDEVTPRDTKFNPWENYYKGIRKANILLKRINECKELTDYELRDYMGRAYFLRAYFYYQLMRLYGPVPIEPDEAYDSDTPANEASVERSSYDDCVNYVVGNFTKAAENLPFEREVSFQYLPTRGAALALKARVLLTWASPLFNGNTYYADWKRSDGTPFIAQKEDNTRWGRAAAVYKQIIDMNKYALNTVERTEGNSHTSGTLELPSTVSHSDFPNGAGNIDPYKSYKSLFDGTVQPEHNKELIYFYTRNNGNDDWIVYPNTLGGINGYSVTQDMVNSYRMADGRQFSEATDEEKSWEAVGQGKSFSGEYILAPERAHCDDNREPRFYASIGFNYCVWPCSSYRGTENFKNFVCTYYKDGNAQPTGTVKVDYNRTGYTSRKWVNQEDIRSWQGDVKTKTYPIVRYAEVLLGYVEAMNELKSPYKDPDTGNTISRDVSQMVYYFNQVRYRAGLPGITDTQAADYETMKALLKLEYKVEFAFEDHRYYDLRRWKDAYTEYNKPVTGFDVSAKMAERRQFYTVKVWNTEKTMKRIFKNKMNFYPIDQGILERNKKLVQNPGWE